MSAQSALDAIGAGIGVALLILSAATWPRWRHLRRRFEAWLTHKRVLRTHYKGR